MKRQTYGHNFTSLWIKPLVQTGRDNVDLVIQSHCYEMLESVLTFHSRFKRPLLKWVTTSIWKRIHTQNKSLQPIPNIQADSKERAKRPFGDQY